MAISKVLLVDNGSDDNDGEKLAEEFPSVTLKRLSENFGFAGGCNRGMEYCLDHGATFIWLVNNDAKVAPESLSLFDASGGAKAGVRCIWRSRSRFANSGRKAHRGQSRNNQLSQCKNKSSITSGIRASLLRLAAWFKLTAKSRGFERSGLVR